MIGQIFVQMGKTRDAIQVLEAAHGEAPKDPILACALAYAKAIAGDRSGSLAVLEGIHRLERTRYLPQYQLALVHIALGDYDRAFTTLERATVDADPALGYLKVDPRVSPVRSDASYARLVDLLGLS